ncbi:MAG: transposase [Desulfatibacillum sp.]|nr:transposase [Desulfatibacillum sp.]
MFIERLWWTLKYYYVYLQEFEDGIQLRKGLAGWFDFYNKERSLQSLDARTPNETYFGLPGPLAWVRDAQWPGILGPEGMITGSPWRCQSTEALVLVKGKLAALM